MASIVTSIPTTIDFQDQTQLYSEDTEGQSSSGLGYYLVMANPLMTFYIANFKMIGAWLAQTFKDALATELKDQVKSKDM